MENTTSSCSWPLLDQSIFESTRGGGYRNGRYCGVESSDEGKTCCFPCPIQDWVYPPEWKHQIRIPNYLSVLSVILCSFLLLSFAVLPPTTTHRHYLSVGLLFPISLISLSFAIPISTSPDLCHDSITPNDMHTSLSCAWTGAFVTLGGLGCVIWVFIRSLWLHVRLVWDASPGRKFKWGSIAVGTLLPLVFVIAILAATGFSYRMGETCLPNHENAILTFWAWLVSFAIAGFLLQAITTGYCIWVYVRSLRRARNSQDLEQSSFRLGNSQLDTWRNVKKLFVLQWRNILVSLFVLVGSIAFFVVFWKQDRKLGRMEDNEETRLAVRDWITCQTLPGRNKDECRKYVEGFTVNFSSVLAALGLVSLLGIEIFILLFRISMLHAWLDLFKNLFQRTRLARPPSPTLTSLEEPVQLLPPTLEKQPPLVSESITITPSCTSDGTAESSLGGPNTHAEQERDRNRLKFFSNDSSAEPSRSNFPASPLTPTLVRTPSFPLRPDSFIPQRRAPTPPISTPPRSYSHFSSPSPTSSKLPKRTASAASTASTKSSPSNSIQRTTSWKLGRGSRTRPRISDPVPGSFVHVDGAFIKGERRRLSTVDDVERDEEDEMRCEESKS